MLVSIHTFFFRAARSLSASAAAKRAVGSRAGSGFEGAAIGAAGSCVALGGGAMGPETVAGNASGDVGRSTPHPGSRLFRR